jgi:hypothetical protein
VINEINQSFMYEEVVALFASVVLPCWLVKCEVGGVKRGRKGTAH